MRKGGEICTLQQVDLVNHIGQQQLVDDDKLPNSFGRQDL
jgi:hypothetical protein